MRNLCLYEIIARNYTDYPNGLSIEVFYVVATSVMEASCIACSRWNGKPHPHMLQTTFIQIPRINTLEDVLRKLVEEGKSWYIGEPIVLFRDSTSP